MPFRFRSDIRYVTGSPQRRALVPPLLGFAPHPDSVNREVLIMCGSHPHTCAWSRPGVLALNDSPGIIRPTLASSPTHGHSGNLGFGLS